MEIIVKSLAETERFAQQLAGLLYPGLVITLDGDLGAGKTTFCGKLIKATGSTQIVSSPTFVIMNIYDGDLPFYHFDLYRLDCLEDLENIVGDDYFPSRDGVTLVEWANRIPEIIPPDKLTLSFEFIDDTSRKIIIGGSLNLRKELEKHGYVRN